MIKRSKTNLALLAGFSIVELMVAMAISSFLVLGVSTMFISTRQSYQVQNALSQLQETGRLAVDRIARDVRMTGFRNTNWAAGPIPGALTATNGASDSITVIYEAALDCNRAPAAATGFVTNNYDVVDNVLRCNGQDLYTGVEQMQIFFGEDTDGDLIANRLVDPETVGLQMDRVVTLSVNLLVNAEDDQIAVGAANVTEGIWSAAPADDGRIRREFAMTIALRNPL